MLNFLSKNSKKASYPQKELSVLLAKIAQIYRVDEIDSIRINYLNKTIEKYGYLPYPQFKALEELSDAEAIYCLIEKLKSAKTLVNKEFIDFSNPSVLARKKIKNSNWFKKEGHNIKLLSLSGLGEGKKGISGHFIDWIKCLITLPIGNIDKGIFPATIYLIPFFEREFDCAYLPKSSEVSKKLLDENLYKFLGLSAIDQVKLFIELAQLCNHPVIYDILPQTARFSKMVISKPEIARWIDINELIDNIIQYLNPICINLEKEFDKVDIENTKKLYIDNLKGNCKKYKGIEEKIASRIEEEIQEYKILVSYQMSFYNKQKEILKKVSSIIEKTSKTTIRKESDIINHDEITSSLIKEGLWTLPGGAWCSSGVAIFDRMNKNKSYPLFKHYNCKSEDVTHFANLDCQTPFFFYCFEENKYNEEVINYYIDYNLNLQKEFNFDGFRIDHIDHIVDEVSQNKKGEPISYRIPSKVLAKLNSTLKKKIPYFGLLAEYMLWDGYYREYHKDMKFDLLWGDDIVAQSIKTPEQIINDNLKLATYNQKQAKNNPLSILKTYNNQDGEFRDINQYPGQLGALGALFKWFKLKFIKGGRYSQRPVLLVDGDESFTKTGIERIISKETSMIRNEDWGFYEKFNALDYFACQDELMLCGKTSLICQEKNGFCAFEIKAEDKNLNYSYLVVANYLSPCEFKDIQNEFGHIEKKNVKGTITKDNTLKLKQGKKLVSYYDFKLDELNKMTFKEQKLENDIIGEITFKELKPAEFKVYRMI